MEEQKKKRDKKYIVGDPSIPKLRNKHLQNKIRSPSIPKMRTKTPQNEISINVKIEANSDIPEGVKNSRYCCVHGDRWI